jgi:hypothetical protein
MENLFEQLGRMKDLMVYEKGMSIDEVSTSRGNVPTPDTKTDNTKEKEEGGDEETKPSTETTKSSEESGDNCFVIKASGEFVVNVNKGSKAVTNFIVNLENSIKNNPSFDKSKVKDGSMYITDITLQGFASNYYGSAVEPDFDNDWCVKWDKRGGLYDGLCSEWNIKPFSGTKNASYSGNKSTNDKLAADRAENAYIALKDKLTDKAKEQGIKISPDLKPKFIKGGTIYTEDKVDENWKTRISNGKINPGQVVLCTAKVCYSLKEEKEEEEEGCPDKCMEKDANGKCVCPESKGLKEVDGKCVCIKDNEPPDENCECKEKEEETCPDSCMEKTEEGKCKCPSDMEYDEETKKCVCKDDKKAKVPGECKCKNKKPPLKCDYSVKKKGVRGTKKNNFVGASLEDSFPVGANNSITIDFDSVVVPDAFYIKHGDQEYWSGFMGSVYDIKYRQVALSIEDRKLMLPIQSKTIKSDIKKSLSNGDNDYSEMDSTIRNFVGELVIYKRKLGLIESINSAISTAGGKMKISSLFENGDGNAESVTDNIIKSGSIRDNIKKYEGIMKRNVSFTIEKENESLPLTVLVFSPLDRTIFTMKVKCQ